MIQARSRSTPIAALVVLMLLTLALPTASASANDAGTGTDAPDDDSSPMVLQPGTYSGRISGAEGDFVDWYRFPVAEGDVVRVTVLRDGYTSYLNAGIYMGETPVKNGWIYYDGTSHEAIATADYVKVALYTDYVSGYGSYIIIVETWQRPEVSVTSPVIETIDTTTELTPVPVTTQRVIRFDVTNAGPGDAPSTPVRAWIASLGSARELGTTIVDLKANETRTIELPWDGTGQVGEANVHVQALASYDLEPSNNAASTRSWVLIKNSGVGLDLLNHHVPIAGQVVHHWYDARGVGLGVSSIPTGFTIHAGRDGALTATGCIHIVWRCI